MRQRTLYWIIGGTVGAAAVFLLYWYVLRAGTYVGSMIRNSKILKEEAVTPEFLAKVKSVARSLNVNPSWLMAIMWKESRFNAQAVNDIGAVGLIQFIPSTALGLGIRPQRLYALTDIEQLDYVKKFYEQPLFNGKLNSYKDMYMATFYPVAMGKNDDYVVGSHIGEEEAARIADANPGIDVNNDGVITVSDFKQYALSGFTLEEQQLLT